MAAKLIEIFMDFETDEDFLSGAIFARDRVNPNMFIYALSVAILHRPSTQIPEIPPLVQSYPEKFIHNRVIREAKKEAGVAPVPDSMILAIPKDFSASNFDVEHRLAYFREDLGMNLHHWHWHLVYPVQGPNTVTEKDRRGELFYYVHQQMVARYNFERWSNGLSLVEPFDDWHKPIYEGYFSKLRSPSPSGVYPGRQSGAILRDVNITDWEFRIKDLERVRDRIVESIHLGAVTNSEGERVPLTESHGTNIIGNIVESNPLSVNPIFYGNLHNDGHTAIAVCHDPDNRHLEGMGVMGDMATAARDPIFYRWHSFIDNLFQEHKNLLKPYTEEQLNFRDIKVNGVEVSSDNELRINTLHTFWEQSDVDISEGLSFSSVRVRFTHLNHRPFTYRIKVENESDVERMGTLRIFLAPNTDESGNPFTLAKQRLLMVEMDKFTAILPPGGRVIERKSSEASVTIPFERTFPKVGDQRWANSIHCGCGWPHHMLLPKGNVRGLSATLFVMVSDFDVDKVDQGDDTGFKTSSSYCGLKDKKYPDARAMGYPFDRPLRDCADDLATFKTGNMSSIDVEIVFDDGFTKSV